MPLEVFGSSSFRFGYSFADIGSSIHYLDLRHTGVEGVYTSSLDLLEFLLGDKLLDLADWVDLADWHRLVWDLPLILHLLGVYFLPGEIITVQGVLEHRAIVIDRLIGIDFFSNCSIVRICVVLLVFLFVVSII